MNPNWQPATLRPYQPAPSAPTDPRDRPLAFVLTPQERDMALFATLTLERRRRERNAMDDKRPAVTP